MQVECMAASDRTASDTLQVELKDLHDVAAQVCNLSDVPVIRAGSPY
jgi:hypothetical protein